MRIVLAALFVSALTFVVGVLGDLSDGPVSGPVVHVTIPPDAVRAHPLPPLLHTDQARAEPRHRRRAIRAVTVAENSVAESYAWVEKPRDVRIKRRPKDDPLARHKTRRAKH